MKELMIVKQLPVIEENLKVLSEEIDRKVEKAINLVCTESTVKDVKNLRADLNKDFKELEEQRKNIKKAVTAPYEAFEGIYKEYISEKFNKADRTLKEKIDEVENALKEEKKAKIEEYFEEKKTAENVLFVEFAQANINITLSASDKSLKEAIDTFIEKIKNDVAIIETQEDSVEIFIEYKKTLNLSNAMLTVSERKKAIEEARKAEENKCTQVEPEHQLEPTPQVTLKAEPLKAPEEVIEISLTVFGTKSQLRALKEYLKQEGIKYE
jgi:hypothetical protein rflaF_12821